MSRPAQFLRYPRLGLEARFVILATVVILAATIAGNRFIFAYEEAQLRAQVRGEAVVLAEAMALSFLHALIYEELGLVEEAGLLDFFIEEITARPDMAVRYVEVLDIGGRVIAHSDFGQLGQIGSDIGGRYGGELTETRTLLREIAGEEVLEVVAPLRIASRSWGTLVLAVSLQAAERELRVFASRLFLLTLVTVALSMLVALLVARALARPIKTLAQAMSQVGAELETDLTVDRGDEIGLLQSSFLDMLARLRGMQREQERTRDAMARAEKLASIGALASGVAHEINNPLGGMKNCLAQMEARPEDGERRKQYIGLMTRALERIEQVVSGLLDFSRRRELEVGEVAIGEVIGSALELVGYRLEKNGIALDVDVDLELPVIEGDRHQLEQVLVNLVLNAVDSMEGGGRLSIGSCGEEGAVRIRVRDTGTGIPDDVGERIFDPFFTTKEVGRGSGLGLAVSLQIIRDHGGDLEFANLPEGGTEFAISLPVGTAEEKIEER
jgi:two-component system, NtrC family, sensor kinase